MDCERSLEPRPAVIHVLTDLRGFTQIATVRALFGLCLLGAACGGQGEVDGSAFDDSEPFQIVKTTLPNAQFGTQYGVTLSAEGGTPPVIRWRIRGGGRLPKGLEIDGAGISPTQARIFGVPREEGSFDFSVFATDVDGASDFARFTLNVLPDAPSPLVEAQLEPGRLGEFFVARFEATGVVASRYDWRLLSGEEALPQGLEFAPNSPSDELAEIRGTPEEGGTFAFEIQVQTGARFDTLRGELEIRFPEVRFVTEEVPDGERGEPYLTTIRVEGGAGQGIQWAIGRSPPNGLRLDLDAPGSSINLTGTPSAEGMTNFDVSAYDPVSGGLATRTFDILITEGRPPLKLLTLTLPPAAVMTPYDASLQASGGTPPYTWTVESELPPGLAVMGDRLVGMPQREASVDIDIQVRDSAGLASSNVVRLEIGPPRLAIISDVLPDAHVGDVYSADIVTQNGSDFGLLWYPGSGDAPPGLQLRSNSSPDGVLFGTPTQAGIYEFQVVVVDPATNRTDSQALMLTVRN